MDFFFKPRGIAIIGATSNSLKGGYSILRNLMNGFKGGIYPVNPRYTEIEGMTCYPSVQKVPDPVDLAIVFVPAARVPQLIRECAKRGIPGVMIESGGFAETGEQGIALQETLKQIAKETGIRLWGPNCMGLVDAVHRYIFSFVSQSIWDERFVAGDISLIVQSGMLSGVFLIDAMTHGTMDVSKVCSIGNKADVDECDILEYLIGDPDTKVVGLYLESIPDGRRFMEICRRSQKPIVILKGGKSPKGAEAAMSHTASLAGNGAVISGAMKQVGVTEADDFKQMLDICRSLAMFPKLSPQSSGRVAVITYSGGAGIVSSDFIDALGLELADLSQTTRDAMKTVFPEWMPVSNPVDLWPAVESNGADKAYITAVRAACADPNVDAIFLHIFVGGFSLTPDMESVAEEVRTSGKPMFCFLMGNAEEAREVHIRTQRLGIPVFRELYRAAECIRAVFSYKKAIERRKPAVASPSPVSISDKFCKILGTEKGSLDEHLSKQILGACDIPVVEEKIISSAEEAQMTALGYGFPVVMKGLSPGEVHKSDLGLVRLGITTVNEAKSGFEALERAMEGKGNILIQRQIQGGLELIAGLVKDPQFGPCVMCGLGGILAEAIGDVVFAAAPLSQSEALDLIGRLRTQKLLNGFRGFPPLDRKALAQILVRLGELGCAYPRIQEIDINPLIVSKGRPVAVDASIIL
ncbi:acetate--CoA ligase family protein [Desulfonema magnum]|uniref:CoA-binding domain-containing protein n=1 Tax=Desulfonema magnum TaxID=45655 RepID=A0A975GT44_9BACT|nr:acetate--CoA ligase family protein [Desulfonema magnum]QTA91738.1 CoA-binding domain-containing protein [Desulfonema magnum]